MMRASQPSLSPMTVRRRTKLRSRRAPQAPPPEPIAAEDEPCGALRCAHCRDNQRRLAIEGRPYSPEYLRRVEQEWQDRCIIV